MFSTRAKADSTNFSNKIILNTVVPEANSSNDLASPPTIHVHHFHHHSCLHHPEVLCQNSQPTGLLESSNEYQYAVILNPNSPLRRTTESPLAAKQSAFTFTRKPASIVTATIRHPIETSFPLQRRYFHSPEPPQRSHSSSNNNPNCTSFTSQMSSPCFLSWDQQHQHQYQYHQQQNQCLRNHANHNECSFANGIDHHIPPPPSPCSRVITRESLQRNATPAHVISAYPYRLVPPGNTNHHHHPNLLEQQRSYQQHCTDCIVPSDVLQPPLFLGNCNAVNDPKFDHRRSQSQPPHRLRQEMQIVRPGSGGGNAAAKKSQPQRNKYASGVI
nr:hypothetical protein HmN_000158100 [Hymenolepis microstoma]